MTTLRRPLLAAALFTSVAAFGLAPAFAQTAPPAADAGAAQSQAGHHNMARKLPGQWVDGRIAFMKAELKITPAQEGPWEQMATAMRQNASALDQAITNARQHRGKMDAVERIETRGELAKLRADNDARLLAAFKPLYASLTPEQQQMANQLVAPRHGGHHGGWRHRA